MRRINYLRRIPKLIIESQQETAELQNKECIELFVNNKMNENVYELYKTAIGKNFVLWQGKTQAQAETDWVNNSRTLKHWLRDRIDWLSYEWKLLLT